jgi:hypothetical protein
MSPVKYDLGFYTAEDGILDSYRRVNLKTYIKFFILIERRCCLYHVFLKIALSYADSTTHPTKLRATRHVYQGLNEQLT